MSNEYAPRPQFLPFHNRLQRWAVLNTHRRAGKTVALVNDLLAGALECDRYRPQMAYIGPTYAQSKRIAWAYLKDFARPWMKGPPSESELKITLINDATINVLGADNADSHRGIYLDGAVMDEYALFRPSVFSQIIRPALSDRQGWGVFASTPRGKNLFYDIFRKGETTPEEWYTMTLRASESGIIGPRELAELRRDMDAEEYAQEYECSFDAALKGAIYADQVNEMLHEGRVVQFDHHDPALPTHWSYDIGMTDATVATAWQFHPSGRINVVAVESTNGATVFHHIERLHQFKGKLGTVWLPHDAKQANNQTGKSVAEQFTAEFKRLGIRGVLRGVPLHKVRDGIAATRALFPRICISETMTDELVEALKAYRRKWDDTLMMFKDEPLHDWACFVPGTQISTPGGKISIERLRKGDLVDTPAGPRKVTHAVTMRADALVELVLTNGKTLVCTANHKLFTQRGLVLADALRYTDVFFTGEEPAWRWIRLISRAGGITGLGKAISSFGRPENSGAKGSEPGCSTRMYGRAPTGLFQKALRYITGITTREITPWEISNYSHAARTGSTTAMGERHSHGGGNPPPEPTLPPTPRPACEGSGQPTGSGLWPLRPQGWRRPGLPQWLGTKAPKGASGTAPSTSPKSPLPLRSRLARFAVRTILQNLAVGSSALGVVRLRRLGVAGQQVHDLTVEGENCFIANGVLSSNSDYADSFRYMAVAVGILEMEGGGGVKSAPTAGSPFADRYDEHGIRIPPQVIVQTQSTLADLFEQNEAKGRILRIS